MKKGKFWDWSNTIFTWEFRLNIEQMSWKVKACGRIKLEEAIELGVWRGVGVPDALFVFANLPPSKYTPCPNVYNCNMNHCHLPGIVYLSFQSVESFKM